MSTSESSTSGSEPSDMQLSVGSDSLIVSSDDSMSLEMDLSEIEATIFDSESADDEERMPPVVTEDWDPEVDPLPEGTGWEDFVGPASSDGSGDEADDEGGRPYEDDLESEPDEDFYIGASSSRLAKHVRESISAMYAKRYEEPRDEHPRGPPSMPHVLTVLKTERPDSFRKELRVTPFTFDRILESISHDTVFSNNSGNEQMPIEDQLAIVLYRVGHSGNGVSLDKVASWSGYAKGTVVLATRRVTAAILSDEFMEVAIRPVTEEEKEEAKRWVESHSCRAWRDGWQMVDRTLIPLYTRPFWYGESYFDRKCNYSLNIQVSASL